MVVQPRPRILLRPWQAVLDHAGFAVADLDYAGSTGLGRDYRRLLDGQWGEADLDDTCALADHLVAEGLADPARLAVRGGSAGGFTVLAVLARRDTFTAGVSYYGVSDLAAFARDTHKFESRYLDRLVGPCPLRSMSMRRGHRCPIWRVSPARCSSCRAWTMRSYRRRSRRRSSTRSPNGEYRTHTSASRARVTASAGRRTSCAA